MNELLNRRVRTVDGHVGIVIKHYYVTGRGIMSI